MKTVLVRISAEVKERILLLAQAGDTVDASLRRALDMPAATDEAALTRALGEWPFKKLQIDEYVTIPYEVDQTTGLANEKKLDRIRRAVYRHQAQAQKKFSMTGTPTGLRIQRVRGANE
jgi:hypothetical protein